MYTAKIICDSLGPNGKRLTTFEITYPKFVHNELMTHRALSRNTASSRAIPYSKNRQAVMDDPVVPVCWGKNQKGMQAREELTFDEQVLVKTAWYEARNEAVRRANVLNGYDVHKQIVNRVVEPYMWITAIVSATEWANFFSLRCHPDAQPEIQKIAYMMEELYFTQEPLQVDANAWHLPYVYEEDHREAYINCASPKASNTISLRNNYLCRISVARCARVSYLTHDGKRDHIEDLRLYNDLVTHVPPHMSPFEHVAQAVEPLDVSKEILSFFAQHLPHMLEDVTYGRWGNFIGWRQYRKNFSNEVTREYTHGGR
jgi:hypothetical protein